MPSTNWLMISSTLSMRRPVPVARTEPLEGLPVIGPDDALLAGQPKHVAGHLMHLLIGIEDEFRVAAAGDLYLGHRGAGLHDPVEGIIAPVHCYGEAYILEALLYLALEVVVIARTVAGALLQFRLDSENLVDLGIVDVNHRTDPRLPSSTRQGRRRPWAAMS